MITLALQFESVMGYIDQFGSRRLRKTGISFIAVDS
jgi:hypothetical protein